MSKENASDALEIAWNIGDKLKQNQYAVLLGVGFITAAITYFISMENLIEEADLKDGQTEKSSEQKIKESAQQLTSTATEYVGLENLGNTCYMNSLFQALSGCPQYVKYCESIYQNKIIENIQCLEKDDEATKAYDLIYEFILVLLQLKENDPDLKHCGRLHQLISEDNEFMRMNEQADSHELYMFVQDHLISLVPKSFNLILEGQGLKGKIVYHAQPQKEMKTENGDNKDSDQEQLKITNSIMFNQEAQQSVLAQSCTTINFGKDDKASLTESITDILDFEQKLIQKQSQNPILSMHETTIVCEDCNNKIGPSANLHRFEFFLDVNLDIPQTNGPVDLRNLLQDYFKPERIEGYTCIKCSLRNYLQKCKNEDNPQNKDPDFVQALDFIQEMYETADIDHEEFVKEFKKFKVQNGNMSTHNIDKEKVIIQKNKLIIKPPKTLCIHFNRLTCDMYGNNIIRRNFVKFPEILDLNDLQDGADQGEKCCSPFDIDLKYKLCSVIQHTGSPNFGHYVAAKRIDDKNWLLCNDKITFVIPADQVMNSFSAYMLFYEKLDDQSE